MSYVLNKIRNSDTYKEAVRNTEDRWSIDYGLNLIEDRGIKFDKTEEDIENEMFEFLDNEINGKF